MLHPAGWRYAGHSMRPLALLVGAALLGGCWAEDDLPGPAACTCDNNGVCNLEREDCVCCPADCPCCRAVDAQGQDVQQAESAAGDKDGAYATLGPNSTLQLLVGREIINQGTSAGGDFLLVGSVSSDSSISVAATCPVGFPSGDGYRVEVSHDGSQWDPVGFWVKSTSPATAGEGQPFSLGCGSANLTTVRWVRLSSFGTNAGAQLDALVALSCLEQ